LKFSASWQKLLLRADSFPQIKGRLSFWPAFVVCLFLGFVAAFALPPIGIWPCLLALPIGFALARDLTFGRAFVMGFALGLGYFINALHWIGYAFLVDADAYLWMMPFAVGGLSAFLALYWGLAFVGARLLVRWRVPWFAAFPASVAVAEILRGILFTGFPWAAPGLVADGMGGVLQLASLIGMQGLTFWLLFWATLVIAMARREITGRALLALAVVLLAILPAAFLWGRSILNGPAEETVPGVRLLLVQPNVSQNDKWQSDNAGAIFEQLLEMSNADGATHIIWPESAVPFLLDESAGAKARIATQLNAGQSLLTGAVRRQIHDGGREDFFTSILMFDEKAAILDVYDKWRLVPGGEFLPLAWALEPLGFRKVVNVPESFSAGAGARSLAIPGAGLAGLLICYEVIFPQKLVDDASRPQWLLNVTNDGWFGLSTGPYQHLAQARMRAVEQGLPVVRAANTGISAIIDGKGRMRAQSALGETTTVAGQLPVAEEVTAFARFGLWLSFLTVLLTILSVTYLSNKPLNTQVDSF
jgi:apolipoprotein N-acyltransferase